MFLVGLVKWWYGDGFVSRGHRSLRDVSHLADFFSIAQLLDTLFAPFRQISAGRVSGPIGVQLRAFFDQLVSRIIGLLVRSATIVAGIVTIAVFSLYQLIVMVVWLFVPLMPMIGLILFAVGWVPSWR